MGEKGTDFLVDTAYSNETTPATLGVESSVNGLRWQQRLKDDRISLALSQAADIPETIAKIAAGRGVGIDDIETFLTPTVRNLMPDPSSFQDMDRAVSRIVSAIMKREKVAVFGDYDVDGATSGAILIRYLSLLGIETISYVPHREKEGYGPNVNAINYLSSNGASIIIMVDCGTSAFDPIENTKNLDIDIIIVDHHIAEPNLPDVYAIINPNRLDEKGSYGNLAAVGVTFLLLVGLNRELRKIEWFDGSSGYSEPDLRLFLDLVALGTICDVVPLKGLNRAYVKQGLKVMAKRKNIGIASIYDLAELESFPGVYQVGYIIGPRINAGGRVGEPSLGTRILATLDKSEAEFIANQLEQYNEERRKIEIDIFDAAVTQVLERESDGNLSPLVIVAGNGWHPGVTGIVASRIKERFRRPSIVIAFDKEIGKASCRSIEGVDIGSAITAARQSGLIINGGGHAMAAGFTVKMTMLEKLGKFLTSRLSDSVESALLNTNLLIDGILTIEGANKNLVKSFEDVGPFGPGNSEPRFVIPKVRIINADVVGNGHIRCSLRGERGGSLKAIAFRSADTALGNYLLSCGDALINLAGYLRINSWKGRDSVQLTIVDASHVE